jgi:glycosyltransferase involved in cell wall biosynthesis
MNVVFADDSIEFDGYSPASQPLDGAPKALACLTTALAMRGHAVTIVNRCAFPVTVEGARWITWDGERPSTADALVAFRRPELLDILPSPARRILWWTGAVAGLEVPAARALLERHQPLVVFISATQRDAWSNSLGLDSAVIEPGVAVSYLDEAPVSPAEPPRAICTCHPLAGLDWLLRIWIDRIRPLTAGAELHVYSGSLDRAQLGAAVPDNIAPVFRLAQSAREHGVTIRRPQPDPQMADDYRKARAHLHPGAGSDIFGFTLAETQAVGVPSVVGAVNPVVMSRVVDGQTGICARTDADYAEAAANLLGNRAVFDRMSANARMLRRARSWAVAATEWEDRFA